jgi:hypothetical protein
MLQVNDYIESLPDRQKMLVQVLHDFLLSFPGVHAKIRYKIPFYDRRTWFCYLNPIKNEGVELAFLNGHKMSNAQGVLDLRGRVQVAGIRFYRVEEMDEEILFEIVQEALLLDEIK